MSALAHLRHRLARREDSEHEQALLRIVIVGLVLAYMAGFHGWPSEWSANNQHIVLVLSGFFAVAVAIFASICAYPGRNVVRRLVGMVADIGGCTWYMWVAGEYGFFVIGIFLFVTFGNGFRYGRRYLFACQLLAIFGMFAVLLYVPFWQEHRIAGVGLMIALVVLPLYVSTLLKRIQEARARAEEANTAKTTFLANMSHEMRTPLNGIVGVVDLLRTTELSTQQAELMQLLRHSVTVLRSLVDDVLDISKIEAGRLSVDVKSFDLYATVNGLIQLLRPHAQSKGLALHAAVDPALDYRLRGDSHHLRQILLNLLGNAIKFTEQGEVTLAVMLTKASADGVTARFEVRDTGIGIRDDLLPHIFERFVQADQSATRRFGGSGLGTTIAKQLVELMGGTIGVASKVGEGTTFWFELPLLHDEAADAAAPAHAAGAGAQHRTLLVADPAGVALASPLLAAAGERVDVIAPSEPVGPRVESLLAAGVEVRALVACCGVDAACAAFAAARQRMGEKPLALVYLAATPLSVVDSARIRSIREACVLLPSATPKLVANAIHAATANADRDTADVVDLTQLIKRDRAHLKVLVAEDNLTNQTIISQLLAHAGHAVVLASDGEQALDLYEREQPDFAILDFNMPHRNGLEVIRAIRAMESPGTRMPAIILSASVTVETRHDAQRAGADEFVGKPFDAADLIAKIDKLADRVRPRRAPAPDGTQPRAPVIASIPERQQRDAGARAIVDAERLAELEDIARDSGFMTELLRGFKSDVESIMQRIDESAAAGRLDALPDLLHALKGAAVGVGARQLAARCEEMPGAGVREPAIVRAALGELRRSIDATFACLDDYARAQHRISL
ncbi:MAG: response regulator [Betaproteobacteria bacterium]|nr:response regulator [Betaproteobacteria bacterium]